MGTFVRGPMAIDAEPIGLVAPSSEWNIVGQIDGASNTVLLVEIAGQRFGYKPQSGETPLWDFPHGTLGHRERAVAAIDAALGWDLIPATTWVTDAPLGPGALQRWVEHEPTDSPVELFSADAVPSEWIPVVAGTDASGSQLILAHEDSSELMRLAVLDALVNNADRKGGHILRCGDGRIMAIDHGICLNEEPKLRTVLWGFASQPIPDVILSELAEADLATDHPEHWPGVTDLERQALIARRDTLLSDRKFPLPSGDWPALPWPLM